MIIEKGEEGTVEILVLISSILSILGSLFIIISFVIFEESRRCGRRILLCLSFADFFAAISWLLTLNEHPSSSDSTSTSLNCYAQGYMLQFFRLSSYLWTSCFTFHLYQIIWKASKTPEVYELRYHLLSWGVPTLISIYFFVQQINGFELIGYSGRPWCWIRSWSGGEWSSDGFTNQMLFFFSPLLIAFGFNFFTYIFLSRKMSNLMSSRLEGRIRKRLLTYVLVFIITICWGFIGQLYQVISPGHIYSHFLLLMDAFFAPSQGFFNAIVYGLNKSLRMRYSSLLFESKDNRYKNQAPFLISEQATLIRED